MNQNLLLQSLAEKGWFVEENFFPNQVCAEFLEELKTQYLKPAKIGKDSEEKLLSSIRNDSIYWLDKQNKSPVQDFYLNKMDEFMLILNRELYLGLKHFEGHFAKYESGGFYKKHLDQFTGNKDRVVSAITYLNTPSNGGELRIFKKENQQIVDIEIKPKPGMFICFLSEQIYHEVLPTSDERFSITGWFRTNPL